MTEPRRLVIDTNVLVSRLLLPSSTPARAVHEAVGRARVLVSDATMNELADVLAREKFDAYLSLSDRQGFLLRLGRIAELVTVVRRIAVCRDPRDDRFLEVAVNGGAEAIITGDRDLLVLGRFEDIEILDPGAYLKRLE